MKTLDSTLQQTLMDCYTSTGLPFVIATDEGKELFCAPDFSRGMLNPDAYRLSGVRFDKSAEPESVLLYYFDENWYSAICRVAPGIQLATLPTCGIMGDFFSADVMRRYLLPGKLADFSHHMTSVPIKEPGQVVHYISLLYFLLTDTHISGGFSKYHMNSLDTEVRDPAPSSMEENIPPLYFSPALISAIKSGDEQEVRRNYRHDFRVFPQSLSSDPLREKRYQFSVMMFSIAYVLRDSAIAENAATVFACESVRRMDQLTTPGDIDRLAFDCALHFCRMVSEEKNSLPLSPAIQNVCEYIRLHIYNSIRLSDLEKETGLNRRTLTMRFKNEVGETIPKYITEKKLEEAKYLLSSSSMSIIEISDLLSFSNQSHLTMRFRERYGVTPNEYRKETNHML